VKIAVPHSKVIATYLQRISNIWRPDLLASAGQRTARRHLSEGIAYAVCAGHEVGALRSIDDFPTAHADKPLGVINTHARQKVADIVATLAARASVQVDGPFSVTRRYTEETVAE
jgi:hypothetical protein